MTDPAMTGADLLFTDVRLMDPGSGLDQPGELLVRDGRVADFGPALGRPDGVETVPGDGAVLCPGTFVNYVCWT